MWLLIIGLLSGLPFVSQWLASNWVTGLPTYRLSWVVVAKTTLSPGIHLTQDQAELLLNYQKEEKATTVHTISSILNWYTQKQFEKGELLDHDGFAPAPLIEAPLNGLIVPVSVKFEYAEGLKSGMRVRFEKIRPPEAQAVPIPNPNSTMEHKSRSQPKVKNLDLQHSVDGLKTKPVVVTLQAIVPAQDKKTAMLYVKVVSPDTDSVKDLTSTDLVPFILPVTP